MPANTPGGTPYAVPSDPVQQWPATSQSVAAKIDEKAPLASPAFTGNPTAPTPAVSDEDTSIATTAFVQAAARAAIELRVGQIAQIGSVTSTGSAQTVPFPQPFAQTPVVVCQSVDNAREAYAAVLSTAPGSFQVLTVNPTTWTPISNVIIHWIAMIPRT